MADPTGNNSAGMFGNAANLSGILPATSLPALGGDLSSAAGTTIITVSRVNGSTLAAIATSGSAANLSGTLPAAAMPALGGDLTSAGGTTTITVVTIGGNAPTAMATATVGQIPATATNDSAASGKVGEYTSLTLAAASAVVLSTGVGTSVLGLGLTAGDWNVWGQAFFHPQSLTVVSGMVAAISTTAGSSAAGLPGLLSGAQNQIGLGAGLTGGSDSSIPVGPTRISIASSATAFLNTSLTFATSTAAVYGILQARRVR